MATKKAIYIIISSLFLVALFLCLFFIYPLYQEILQKSDDLVLQRNNRLILQSQFDEAAKFKEKYEDYKANLKKADSMSTDSNNPVDFIEFLEQTASGLNIKLKISTPTSTKEDGLKYQNYELSISGTFSNTLKFIDSLEAGAYLIKVKNISLDGHRPTQTTTKTSSKTSKSLAAQEINGTVSIKVFSK